LVIVPIDPLSFPAIIITSSFCLIFCITVPLEQVIQFS
jgi:hypothetical protein